MTTLKYLKTILKKRKTLLRRYTSTSINIDKNVSIKSVKSINNSSIAGKINIGKDFYIIDSTLKGKMTIGDYCRIKGCDILGDLRIGDFTSLWGPGIVIRQKLNKIEIGNFCSIAKNVTIQEYNHNFKKATTYYIGQNVFGEYWENEVISSGDIIIKNDVWMGEKCTILGNVTIGNSAVIGAGSVVTKNIPDYAIAVGSPAKVIGYRFEPDVIDLLKDLKWWNWDIEKIKRNKAFFENELNIELLNNVI